MFGPGRTTQAGIEVFVDDSFYRFFKVPITSNKPFMSIITKAFKKAGVAAVRSVKNKITSMNAVATGFMRKTVVAGVRVKYGKNIKTPIEMTVGTAAWYDILVHEGLGVHGGYRTIPAQYRPTEFQKAIVEPSPEERKEYYKRSPKVPRPFLTEGIRDAQGVIASEISKGFSTALSSLGSQRGVPRHKIESILGTGGLI